MVDALGIAGDLLADDAGGVAVVLGAAHAADGALIQQLDLERAGSGQSCGHTDIRAGIFGRNIHDRQHKRPHEGRHPGE